MKSRLLICITAAFTMASSACAQEREAPTIDIIPISPVAATSASANFTAPDEDWRDLDPENTLYITTQYGTFVIEMADEFAPKHVAQIKTLARQKFYDDITFHRVIADFMNQTGDPRGDGTGDSHLPDIPQEFQFRRAPSQKVVLVGREMSRDGEVDTGFYKSFPVATKPAAQAILTKDGKVDAWGLHCPGTTSMARNGNDVNSGNSQFFLMRAAYPSLNQQYSIWGMTVYGREHLTDIKVGTKGETPNFRPDKMDTVRVAADIPESERLNVQVLRTDSPSFRRYLETLKTPAGIYPAACDITVPSRLVP